MKKIISVILTLTLILSALPLGLFSITASAATDGYYTYSVSNGKATITNVDTSISGSVTIPSTLGGYPVTSIGDDAFRGCTGLTSVTIPDSVTSIGDFAFYGCTGLASVTIGNSVTSIGYFAFHGCTGLTSVTIGNSVTYIRNRAFYGCTGLTSVTIPDSVTSIGYMAFYQCTGLTSVTIPDSVTSIEYEAFYGCTGLEKITVDSKNTVYHSSGNCLIETATKTLVIGCKNSVIPTDGSVTRILDGAFSRCTGLSSVTIPDSVTSIGDGVFSFCTGLEKITVDSKNTVYHSSGNCLIETATKTLVNGCKNSAIPTDGSVTSIENGAFRGCTGLTSVTIPDSVTSIGSFAFTRCTGLTSVTIPDSVTSMGDFVFDGCTGLTSVIIGNSVTSIECGVFESCTGLTSVTIPDSVTSIGDRAFYGCTGLTSVTIPNSVTSIGEEAFYYCTGLKDVYYLGSSSDRNYIEGYNEIPASATWHYDECVVAEEHSYTLNDGNVCAECYKCKMPTLESQTDTSVILKRVEGLEYSKDGTTWQSSNVFTGLSPATKYTFYQRLANIDKPSFPFQATTLKTTVSAPIAPTVSSKTDITVTLTAISGMEYSKDGIIWQSSNVFGGLSPNTTYTFYQRVAESNSNYASEKSAGLSVTTLKSAPLPPSAPTVASKTDTTVTLTAVSGMEYSKDGVHWQNSNAFTSLLPNTTYTFYQRVAATNTQDASDKSAGLSVTTLKSTVSTPAAPTLESKTDTSVTLTAVAGMEYSKNGTTWQSSNVFTGLLPNTTYTFYQRVAESNSNYVSEKSAGLSVTLSNIKATLCQENFETLCSYIEKNGETNTDGYKYILYVNEDTSTLYKLYLIKRETDIKFQLEFETSGVCNTTEMFLDKTSNQVEIHNEILYASQYYTDRINNTLTIDRSKHTFNSTYAAQNDGLYFDLETVSQLLTLNIKLISVCIDGYIYENLGFGLNGLGFENFYCAEAPCETHQYDWNVNDDMHYGTCSLCHILDCGNHIWKESDTVQNFEVCSICKCVTSTVSPDAPKLIKVTQTSVELQKYAYYEYSKDGVNWQSSNVFTGLLPNTSYTFYQRFANGIRKSSDLGKSLSVTTLKKSPCSITPAKPIVASYTVTKIVLVPRDGYEYSIDGINWTSDNTFSSLKSNTKYTFYQRIAETDSELASEKSVGVSVSTDKLNATSASSLNLILLKEYIKLYGTLGSDGRYSVSLTSSTSDQTTSMFVKDDKLYITFSHSMGNTQVGKAWAMVFQITDITQYLVIDFECIYWAKAISSKRDIVDEQIVIDRSKHTKESTYTLEGEGFLISSTNLSKDFNDIVEVVLEAWDSYIYNKLGFGLSGLGFVSYDGCGEPACDWLTGYHTGGDEVRNKRTPHCTLDGYTGDIYCTDCRQLKEKGSAISCTGEHTYTNSCDKVCNVCGEERIVEHTYTNDCDANCNVCNAERTANHLYDNECDESCNLCGHTIKPPHIYSDKDDLICNCCGHERPPYTPGDLDDNDDVTDRDAVHLLYHTFLPDLYPVNQDCDFNNDGYVNDKDAVYLLYHTFLPDLYPIS